MDASNVFSIFKNSKTKTKEEHDTMRQISRSETPSGLIENILHIARAQQPKVFVWSHLCPETEHVRVLNDGHVCTFCFVDQDGAYHKRKD